MEVRKWRLENGGLKMEVRKWSLENGSQKMEVRKSVTSSSTNLIRLQKSPTLFIGLTNLLINKFPLLASNSFNSTLCEIEL